MTINKRLFRVGAVALALVAAAPLAACGTSSGFSLSSLLGGGAPVVTPKTPKQIYADGVGAYEVARTIANKYEALPVCPAGAPVCKSQAVVDSIERADTVAWDNIQKAKVVVEADNPNADTLSRVLADLNAATTAFTTATAPLKVN